jgi:hypothetical protein
MSLPSSNIVSTDEERFESLCGYGVGFTRTESATVVD